MLEAYRGYPSTKLEFNHNMISPIKLASLPPNHLHIEPRDQQWWGSSSTPSI